MFGGSDATNWLSSSDSIGLKAGKSHPYVQEGPGSVFN